MELGDKINKLTFIEDLGMREYGTQGKTTRFGLFLCECGNKEEKRVTCVKHGKTKSCGCAHKGINKKHGLTYHVLHRTYIDMRRRCYNKNNLNYTCYGERGITVCDEWKNDFIAFYNWAIENGWQEGLQIDRIDNNGNYEPNNCQFVTCTANTAIGKRRMQKDNTSGYVGVNKTKCSFVSSITINKKVIRLGSFKTIEEAVEARINAEIEYLGEQKTNFHYVKKVDG